jgi:hypothetical protein
MSDTIEQTIERLRNELYGSRLRDLDALLAERDRLLAENGRLRAFIKRVARLPIDTDTDPEEYLDVVFEADGIAIEEIVREYEREALKNTPS